MEISVINRISDFEAGISSLNKLNNPSLLSKVVAVSGIEKIYQAYSFWKWGAFILALLASLSTIINRLKILIIRLRRNHSLPAQPLYDTDFDTDTDDASSCSSSDNEEEYEEEPSTSRNWRRVDEDFRVRGSVHFIDDQWRNGSSTLRKRRSSCSIGDLFSWAEELTSGKSVVKLWDNLGLGFGFDCDESDDVLNVYDVNRETVIGSIFGGKSDFQAVTAPPSSSPSVVVSAGADSSTRLVAVSTWDTRLPCRKPVILREWTPENPMEKISAVKADGVEKVYLTGDVTGKVTVGDMRKVGSPLRNVTDSEVDTWWDADAVIVSDESM